MAVFLDNMTSLRELALHKCDMDPEQNQDEGVRALAGALRRNSNILGVVFSPTFEDVQMLPVLEGLPSIHSLQFLHLAMKDTESAPNENVAAYLEVAAKCKSLRRFEIYDIIDERCFRALIDVIPKLQMHQVRISIKLDCTLHDRKLRLLAALKRNYKLLAATAIMRANDHDEDMFVDPNERDELARCFLRNLHLKEWSENPALVPQHLWPEALKLAREAGHESLWQSLLLVAPEVAALFGNKRKRKRPQFYAPS